MSIRVYAPGSDIVSGIAVGFRGLGIKGSLIPSSGDAGPALAYPFIDPVADADAEFQVQVLTWPSAGVLSVNEDSSFTFTGAPDGSYSFTWRLKRNGVLVRDYETALLVGEVTETVGQDFSFGWKVVERVGQSFSFTMPVVERVSRDFSFTTVVQERVGQGFGFTMPVVERVGQSFSFTMPVVERVGADFSMPVAAVTETVGQDFTFAWDMEQDGTVTADFSFQWMVASSVGASFTFTMPVVERVGQDFTFTVPLAERVGAAFGFNWQVERLSGGGGDCPTVEQIAAAVLATLGPALAQLQVPIEQIQTKVDAAL